MTVHISARLAWHDSGWNGRICRDPASNTYCVGQYTFQRDLLAKRDLEWEQPNCGRACADLDRSPPCVHSINAFGDTSISAYGPPPEWFQDTTEDKRWTMKPATVSIWPYEEMYKDEVLNPNGPPKYDPVARREAANEFFEQIDEDKSLVFYYANYSNPFSEEDRRNYVVVGMSRVKQVGPELLWAGQSEQMRDRYGPNAWFRDITSHYPDQGLRIPYHSHMDDPDVLERLLFVPDNPRDFKYATRHITDDGALSLVERFGEIVGLLQEIGDESENWSARQSWLAGLLAELWSSRGLYPGLPKVMDYLGFAAGVSYCIDQSKMGKSADAIHAALFEALEGGAAPNELVDESLNGARRKWRYLVPGQQDLLRTVLPRFDIATSQVADVIDEPETVSIWSSHEDIIDDPYILCEEHVGDGPDDVIPFGRVDHGMLPDPDVGASLVDSDDPRRLRALVVDQLKRERQHTFQRAQSVLDSVNHRLSFLPEWKRAQFTQRHLEVEQAALEPAVAYRTSDETLYLYRRQIFKDERTVEAAMRDLVARGDVELRFPMTDATWRTLLTDPDSAIAQQYPDSYAQALDAQIAACQTIFRKPLAVLAGEAGTGKSTIVKALIAGIEKAHGTGASVQLLAPTGKAADRMRERTGRDARTIHSFLASLGWLNDNLDFKPRGGRREEGVSTFIVDEASMLDLTLFATLVRAINWNAVQRFILVGDPNQLPPIGAGKTFADVIDWLRTESPDNLAELTTSVRHLENQLSGRGTGILDLARLYRRRPLADTKSADEDIAEEEMLERLQEGGDVAGDLRVLYWSDPEALEAVLMRTLVSDMEDDTGTKLDPEKRYKLWSAYFGRGDGETENPERSQVLTPYRGELAGTEHLNLLLQRERAGWLLEEKGTLGGITYWDKTIQVQNRTGRRGLWAYNTSTRKKEQIDLFNGEIGTVKIHGFDGRKWRSPHFRIGQFQVVFTRKEHLWVDYGSDRQVEENLELAYVISVHKAQGSEFERVYFVVPKHRQALLWRELFYTGLTRAQRHCTLLVEEDITPLLRIRRREMSQLARINSSLFGFTPVPEALEQMRGWYEEGKIHRALTGDMVRSKSEVIIANMLHDRDVPFVYEMPLRAPDGTMVLPDFTIQWRGAEWYWEHEGMLHDAKYRNRQEAKHAWYAKHGFSDRLIVTTEGPGFDSEAVRILADKHFGA